MAQTINIEARGLYTHPNELGLPQGALLEADNVSIDRENMISKRRGFGRIDTEFSIGAGSDRIQDMVYFKDRLVVHTTGGYLYYYEPGSGWIGIGAGPYVAIDSNEGVRFQTAGKSLYFTTTEGVFKLDALTGTPRRSGAIKAMGATAVALQDDVGWFLSDSQVAYRMVWGYTDANGVRVIGTPSERVVVINDSVANQHTRVTWVVPSDASADMFFQVYRSNQSVSALVPADDNMVKIYERSPTAAELSTGSIVIVDTVEDGVNGEALYTNTTQTRFGIQDANERPPKAQDICVFKDHMFFANTVEPHRLSLALAAVNGDTGLTLGVRLNFVWEDGYSIQLISTNGAVTGNFFFLDAGAGVQDTIQGIIAAFNRTTTRAKAFYGSGFNDNTGIMLIENVDITTPGFHVWATSCPEAWTPTMPVAMPYGFDSSTSLTRLVGGTTVEAPGGQRHGFKVGDTIVVELRDGGPADPNFPTGTYTVSAVPNTFSFRYLNSGAVTSQNGTSKLQVRLSTTDLTSLKSGQDVELNTVYFSKYQLYEYVPLINKFSFGDASIKIDRILPLRDSMIVLKKDGIWRLTGFNRDDFAAYPLDLTTSIRGTNTACVGANHVWCNSDQGIITINDTRVLTMSRPVENYLLKLNQSLGSDWSTATGIYYETEKKYILFHKLKSADTHNVKATVFNSATETWTTWSLDQRGVVISPEDKLIIGDVGDATALVERKSYDYRDYADKDFSIEIISSDGFEVTLDTAEGLSKGDVIYQDDARWSVITSISGNVVTVNDDLAWTPDVVRAYPHIPVIVRGAPLSPGGPGTMKQFREITAFFRKATFAEARLGFATDIVPGFEDVPVAGYQSDGWGMTPFGDDPFGGDAPQESVTIRTYIPRNKQRGNLLYWRVTEAEAWSFFEWQGAAVTVNGMSERTGK